jgi:hypothetical protein
MGLCGKDMPKPPTAHLPNMRQTSIYAPTHTKWRDTMLDLDDVIFWTAVTAMNVVVIGLAVLAHLV